jgi:TolA-binding protein
VAGSLKQLGERVAAALDSSVPALTRAQAIEQARRGFLQQRARPHSFDFSWARLAWVSGAVLTLLLAFSLLTLRRPAALTFTVDGSAFAVKSWLAAPESAPLHVDFSEGTQIRLLPAARAKITELGAHGASLALESGELHAEVVHQASSAWRVEAGPFTVNVTGTVFDVDWEPSAQQLTVSVSRGSVSVRDASTGSEQAVRAPQTLRTTASLHRFELSQTDAPPPPPSASAPPVAGASAAASAEAASDAREASATPSAVTSSKADSAASEWRALARRGSLREAFASAEALGFTQTCASASPAELLLLGDGARLSGKPERAVEALLALRQRYPNDPRRAAAAFALGKVAFDQRGAYEQAAAWFSTSLREQPGGPLAREAAGRLIEALRRADDSAGARRAAREYLDAYPEGPHADLARSVLR